MTKHLLAIVFAWILAGCATQTLCDYVVCTEGTGGEGGAGGEGEGGEGGGGG
jgi:hypothetical protein